MTALSLSFLPPTLGTAWTHVPTQSLSAHPQGGGLGARRPPPEKSPGRRRWFRSCRHWTRGWPWSSPTRARPTWHGPSRSLRAWPLTPWARWSTTASWRSPTAWVSCPPAPAPGSEGRYPSLTGLDEHVKVVKEKVQSVSSQESCENCDKLKRSSSSKIKSLFKKKKWNEECGGGGCLALKRTNKKPKYIFFCDLCDLFFPPSFHWNITLSGSPRLEAILFSSMLFCSLVVAQLTVVKGQGSVPAANKTTKQFMACLQFFFFFFFS